MSKGYVKIRTVAEVDSLPVGTILKAGDEQSIWYRSNSGWLFIAHNMHPISWTWNEGHLPVRVIWSWE